MFRDAYGDDTSLWSFYITAELQQALRAQDVAAMTLEQLLRAAEPLSQAATAAISGVIEVPMEPGDARQPKCALDVLFHLKDDSPQVNASTASQLALHRQPALHC